mmetsp:Transcript_85901/g.256172  ORF Transcript_85901/g.256172 Transcript_85901/m.256172 type:complete len:414 (-) Transcript_85901:102-1343(-)
MTSTWLCPALSARTLGTTSSASANFSTAYWSRPGTVAPNCCNWWASSISVAPAPGTKFVSRVVQRTTFTALSMALSSSSNTLGLALLRTTVAIFASRLLRIVSLWLAISSTLMLSTYPSSSGRGGPVRMMEVAPTVRHTRLSSNLEVIFSARILYLFRKCSAISEMEPPEMTTSTPASLMLLMNSSIRDSSPLVKFISCSAFSSITVPLVSVPCISMPEAYTATLAFSLCVSTPLVSRAMAMPSTTNEPLMLPPWTLVTRTLSTSNLLGVAGITFTHASATSFASSVSKPNCLAEIAVLMHLASCSTERTSVQDQALASVRRPMALSLASSYPFSTSLAWMPSFSSSSARCRSSPPKLTTRFVASPHSCSCAFAAMTTSLAAGCMTSNSVITVLVSLVTECLPRWFTMSLFMP